MKIYPVRLASVIVGATLVAACSNESTSPGGDDFLGLTKITISGDQGGGTRSDTAVAQPFTCGADSTGTGMSVGPCPGGHFEGFVTGAIAGTDSSDATNPVANVQVKVFAIDSWKGDIPVVGSLLGSAVTPADGSWKLPELPAGPYALMFLPPADSKYRGVWTLGTASPASSTHPWRIGLPLK